MLASGDGTRLRSVGLYMGINTGWEACLLSALLSVLFAGRERGRGCEGVARALLQSRSHRIEMHS